MINSKIFFLFFHTNYIFFLPPSPPLSKRKDVLETNFSLFGLIVKKIVRTNKKNKMASNLVILIRDNIIDGLLQIMVTFV